MENKIIEWFRFIYIILIDIKRPTNSNHTTERYLYLVFGVLGIIYRESIKNKIKLMKNKKENNIKSCTKNLNRRNYYF